MFTFRFVTDVWIPPGYQVTLRTSKDWGGHLSGEYAGGAWLYRLNEAEFGPEVEYKLFLEPDRWMKQYPNPRLRLEPGGEETVREAEVEFDVEAESGRGEDHLAQAPGGRAVGSPGSKGKGTSMTPQMGRLVNRTVLVSIPALFSDGACHPYTLLGVELHGLWLRSDELTRRLLTDETEDYAATDPAVFVPFAQIASVVVPTATAAPPPPGAEGTAAAESAPAAGTPAGEQPRRAGKRSPGAAGANDGRQPKS